MAILRNSFAALVRTTPSSEDADSGPFRLRPADGDATEDSAQRMFGFVYAEQQGAGSVRVQVLASFGDGVWAIFGEKTLTTDGAHMMGFSDIDSIPPYMRVRLFALPPDGSQEKPSFMAVFRIASNAPFRAEPAQVPVIVERYPTEQAFDRWQDEQPVDNGTGGV